MTHTGTGNSRRFLFLQGPHGPFFSQLAKQLQKSGAQCWRVGFNAGDAVFWRDRSTYLPFTGHVDDWPKRLEELLQKHLITDLVLYGDTRPVHAEAIRCAQTRGVHIHIFEEGYLRPYWITYEHGGANGHSNLMNISLDQIASASKDAPFDPPMPPCHWGDMRQHVFYGALYHWFVLCWNQRYPRFQPHRSLKVAEEFRLYLRRFLLMPFQALERMIATHRIRTGSFPYHLALLQLEHDASFQTHGRFETQSAFMAYVIDAFKKGAPGHHHLVFKAHPLEDGRSPLRQDIRNLAKANGISERVHYVRGGKLAGLLDQARSAVTVNSTSGQQALWRGIPLRVFGAAVFAKPKLVSEQPLSVFFADPDRPDTKAYRRFRDFLLATSQLPGSYYASKGRQQVIRKVTDMMLSRQDPYTLAPPKSAALRQQLRAVQ